MLYLTIGIIGLVCIGKETIGNMLLSVAAAVVGAVETIVEKITN